MVILATIVASIVHSSEIQSTEVFIRLNRTLDWQYFEEKKVIIAGTLT